MTIKLNRTPIGWTAVEEDKYDGPGSPIGSGTTDIAAIRDLIEQERERAKLWRPIDNLTGEQLAEMANTPVLLLLETTIDVWRTPTTYGLSLNRVVGWWNGEEWESNIYETDREGCHLIEIIPTHWMPLPE